MDSYGDGNTYRGMVCKDSEIKTIEINRYNADVERLVEAAREIVETDDGSDDCKCPRCGAIRRLKTALEPFNK